MSMQPQRQPLLTDEGPRQDQIRIIGVELAWTPDPANGSTREVELEMFSCQHTIPRPGPYGYGAQLRITVHTSDGDKTMTTAVR